MPRLDVILQSYLDQGVIEPSTSAWNSPLHAVCKSVKRSHRHTSQNKDKVKSHVGSSMSQWPNRVQPASHTWHRILLDYMLTPYHNGPKPHYFSSIDVSNMFYQVRLHEDSRDITSFQWWDKAFRFTRIAQGLKVSSWYSSLIMQQILGDLKDKPVFHYIEDVIITSATLEEHVRLLDTVLSRFAQHQLLISPAKCKFAASSIEFLGYEFKADTYAPSPKHIAALKTYPVPKNAKQVKTFVGLCCFFHTFIPKKGTLCAPLYHLTKKSSRFKWSSKCQQNFLALKKILTEPPVLKLPRLDEPFLYERALKQAC